MWRGCHNKVGYDSKLLLKKSKKQREVILKYLFTYLLLIIFLSGIYNCSGGSSSNQNDNPDTPVGPTSLAENYEASYKYDELGRVIKIKYENGQTINYEYDLAGNLERSYIIIKLINS